MHGSRSVIVCANECNTYEVEVEQYECVLEVGEWRVRRDDGTDGRDCESWRNTYHLLTHVFGVHTRSRNNEQNVAGEEFEKVEAFP